MALELGRGLALGDKSPQLAWELSRTRHAALVRTQTKQSRLVLARAELTETKQSRTVGSSQSTIQRLIERDYRWGFASDVESVSIPKGLSAETIRLISAKREEPEWLLNFRLDAYQRWLKMEPPTWSQLHHPPIDFQDMCYYSEPKQKHQAKEEEIDPKILDTYQKLGIPLSSSGDVSTSAGCSSSIAMDAVFDSTSVAITHKKKLEEEGVIFCSISEAVRKYPELVHSYLGRVVPAGDNFYAALNSAVFSDGSFCYVPKNTRPSMDISTQFRINASETGQFERTLIIVDEGGCVNYLEGCTATAYATNQLHAAVVELYCAQGAQINYSTVQNWYSGDSEGRGGIYNFVTKRGICDGDNSKISWTQVETGSAITWKYPSVVLRGENSVGEFYSVALTKNQQQADTGTKMIHLGKNSRSRIVSKGISAGKSLNCYRGLVQVQASATDARNFSQCDSLLIGDNCAANTYPTIQVRNPTARIEHEATTSKVSEDQVFYFQQRGVSPEKAVAAIVGGFCREVVEELPYEFKVELNELLSLKLEGSVG